MRLADIRKGRRYLTDRGYGVVVALERHNRLDRRGRRHWFMAFTLGVTRGDGRTFMLYGLERSDFLKEAAAKGGTE